MSFIREYGQNHLLATWLRKIEMRISLDDEPIYSQFLYAIRMLSCPRYPGEKKQS